MRIQTFAATLVLLLTSLPAFATTRDLNAELTAGNKALAAKNYTVAYKQFARFAAHNALAQFDLGLFEYEGWGRPVNPAAACAWFDKAAHGDIPAAQQFLGDCLAQGIGRSADGKAAELWYRKAAQSGIAYALCSAGTLYITGQVLEKDIPHGLQLCAEAAQAGSTPAMLRLADYYREGTEVPQNLTAARSWYQQAAELHNLQAQFRLGVMLSQGEGGDADLNLALSWLENAAVSGYAPAYLPVAILYANTVPDPQTGVLPPESLAKIYIWDQAAKATSSSTAELAEIAHIEQLVLAVMPAQWKPELDRRVAEHLAKFAAN